jgi:hypothetical protein
LCSKGKVRTARAAYEQDVAAHEPALDYQGDPVGGVARGVDNVDGHLAQGQDVAVGDVPVHALGPRQLVHDELAPERCGEGWPAAYVVGVGVGVHGHCDPESQGVEAVPGYLVALHEGI